MLRMTAVVSRSPSSQRAPDLEALVPPEQPAQLMTGSAGFHGQPARATVQLQSARLHPGKPALCENPTYSVMYR